MDVNLVSSSGEFYLVTWTEDKAIGILAYHFHEIPQTGDHPRIHRYGLRKLIGPSSVVAEFIQTFGSPSTAGRLTVTHQKTGSSVVLAGVQALLEYVGVMTQVDGMTVISPPPDLSRDAVVFVVLSP